MKTMLLNNADFKNKTYDFRYTSAGYYDLVYDDFNFSFKYQPYDEPKQLGFMDTLLGDWLENPVLYGVYEADELLGIIELSMESWNNRLRISNILVFENYRGSGVGTQLMHQAKAYAQELGARMIVLETQSCNKPAITFYQKHGFKIIGFDYASYSNEDVSKHEIRIEMGLFL